MQASGSSMTRTCSQLRLCEILSPSTEARDRSAKLRVYAREAVAHVWFVNPITHTLEILRLDGATYRVADAASLRRLKDDVAGGVFAPHCRKLLERPEMAAHLT